MEYRNLGKSNLKISRIAFGCMSLSTRYDEAAPLLHEAWDKGINFFDTADLYDKGRNEEIVGKALKGIRNRVIIATKVGNQWRPDGSGWDWNPTKAYILEAVHKSLERLQTDYIDLYQLHGGTIDDPIDETIEAFEILKSKGLIRYYGISSIRPNVIREYVKRSDIVSNMMQYSLLDRRPEESCLDDLQENQISVIVRGALAKGLLAGKEAKSYLGHSEAQVRLAQQLLTNHSPDRTSGQTALRFCLAHPAVTTIAAGIRTQDQLRENATVFESTELSASILETLKQGVPAAVYEQHR